MEGRRGSRYVWRLGQCLALGWTLGEERSLTVASLLRFVLGIEVGAVVCHRTYRPAGLLAVKQESPPNGGRIPFQAGNRRCLWVDPSFCIALTLRIVWPHRLPQTLSTDASAPLTVLGPARDLLYLGVAPCVKAFEGCRGVSCCRHGERKFEKSCEEGRRAERPAAYAPGLGSRYVRGPEVWRAFAPPRASAENLGLDFGV